VGRQRPLVCALHLGQRVFLTAQDTRMLPVSRGAPAGGRAKSLSPTALPTSRPVAGRGVGSHSQEKETTHLPVAVRRRVAVLGMPASGRCSPTWLRPTLETTHRCSALASAQPTGTCEQVRLV